MQAYPRLLYGCRFKFHSFVARPLASVEDSVTGGVRRGGYLRPSETRVEGGFLAGVRLVGSSRRAFQFSGRLEHCRKKTRLGGRLGTAELEGAEKRVAMQSVKIKCRGDIADGLVEALLCFGAGSCSIEDAHVGDRREEEVFSDGPVPWQAEHRQLWEQSHITAIFPEDQDVGEAIAMASNSIGFNEMPQYEIDLVEDQEWMEQLQGIFEPQEVAAGLWIVPNWRVPPDPTAVNVLLDPGLAFGTGEHPTTRLCLQWLHRVMRGGESVMDYGTGSGILSIAALKMGATRAVGVDSDPMAILSASCNASLNMIEDDRFQVLLSDDSGGDPVPVTAARQPAFGNFMDENQNHNGNLDFDIVVANILVNPLVDLCGRIASYARPGGLVGLSGLLPEQVQQVQSAYEQYLDSIQVTQDSGWACITGVKKR